MVRRSPSMQRKSVELTVNSREERLSMFGHVFVQERQLVYQQLTYSVSLWSPKYIHWIRMLSGLLSSSLWELLGVPSHALINLQFPFSTFDAPELSIWSSIFDNSSILLPSTSHNLKEYCFWRTGGRWGGRGGGCHTATAAQLHYAGVVGSWWSFNIKLQSEFCPKLFAPILFNGHILLHFRLQSSLFELHFDVFYPFKSTLSDFSDIYCQMHYLVNNLYLADYLYLYNPHLHQSLYDSSSHLLCLECFSRLCCFWTYIVFQNNN